MGIVFDIEPEEAAFPKYAEVNSTLAYPFALEGSVTFPPLIFGCVVDKPT